MSYFSLFFSSFSGLAVSLQLLHGDIEQIRREYTSMFTHGVSITRKLGFSNIIMPGKLKRKTTLNKQQKKELVRNYLSFSSFLNNYCILKLKLFQQLLC